MTAAASERCPVAPNEASREIAARLTTSEHRIPGEMASNVVDELLSGRVTILRSLAHRLDDDRIDVAAELVAERLGVALQHRPSPARERW